MTIDFDVQVVLDRSGSMEDSWNSTLSGLNKYVIKLANKDGIKAKITLMTFSSEGMETIRQMVPAKIFAAVTARDISPSGNTPLFDAIGRGIEDLRNRLSDHRKALLVMTDGEENASQIYTGEAVKAMIESARKDDWLLMYLGAGHDAAAQAEALGFDPAHTGQYSKSATKATFDVAAENMGSYAKTGKPSSGALTSAQRQIMLDEF